MQEAERVRAEEMRKTQMASSQQRAELARYEDELARSRAGQEHQKAQERNQQLVELQLSATRRQEEEKLRIQAQIEAERRATEQYRVSVLCPKAVNCLCKPVK